MTEARGAQIGDVLLDRFVLERLLGTGSVAEVWLGRPLVGGEAVAIKTLHPWVVAEPQVIQRFVREAAIAKRLLSPHLCTLREAPTVQTTAAGPLSLVFDYTPGETLQARLARGPVALDDAWAFADQVLGGLEVAHAVGVVHRDLKPSNLYLTEDVPTRVKILDFGIAKLLYESTDAAHGRPLTEEAGLLGSALHMAPEQGANPLGVDARADLYSLVSILYQMLTGRPPFAHASPLVLTSLKTSWPAPRLSQARRDVAWPAALEALFVQGLAVDPNARQPSATTLRAALAETRALVAGLPPPAAYGSFDDRFGPR